MTHNFTYDIDRLTEFSNQIKEVLLEELERQGYLRIPASKINEEIAILIHRPSWLGSFIKRWFNNNDEYKISIIKMLEIADVDKKKNTGCGVVSIVDKQRQDTE